MDESDDDFKELCASFFQRVKKKGMKEVSGEKKAQNSTRKRSRPRKTNQADIKNKTLQATVEKKLPSDSHVHRTPNQATATCQEAKSNVEDSVLAAATGQPVFCQEAQSAQAEGAPGVDSQSLPSCSNTSVPSPAKPRASELVLQRMQQFKRTEPKRLRRASEESSLKTSSEESGPKRSQEKVVVGNGDAPSPAAASDAAVALALQQALGRDAASAREDGLEEKGLFFCQICQKNLSAMNVIRREQHVNRCLDEAEKTPQPTSPQVPDCPICGKPLLTPKSRLSHLKQCAAKLEVSPQLLLQAVRLQAAQSEVDGGPQTPSAHTGSLKRKGAGSKKEPQKRHKVHKPEPLSEDLLVAMALSRSEMEHCPAMPTLSLESAFSERIKPGAEKKSRKKKPLMSPPQLLVQDSRITGRQIEDRVAQLLSEEMELSNTPPLPTSKIFKEGLEEAGWYLQLPKGKQNFLWKGSALAGAWTEEAFYTVGLLPPMVSHRPAKEPETLVPPKQSDPDGHRPPVLHGRALPVGQSPRKPLLSASQRERQALQDLVDLAEEGLNASLWPGSSGEPTELDLIPSSLPLTGFVVPSKEKLLKRGDHSKLSLQLLVTDFGAMVNNPHLSDVQFQTDSGEVLYAHKFVLYARCPLLMQYVNKEGFCAVEDGDLTQRVLLSGVSSEAAHAFLDYLYVADTDLSPSLAPDLCSLALRFGVSDLVHLCGQVPAMLDLEERQQEEKEDENCESRAENFQELLRSVWADEEEEADTLLKSEVLEEDRENMNEAEMEEIYEFAATQRKLLQEEQAADRQKDPDQRGEASPAAVPLRAGVHGNRQLENTEQRVSKELPGSWENPRHSRQPLQKQCSEGSGGAEIQDQETPREAASPCSSSSPRGGHQSESEESSLSCPATAHDYRQQFESTQEFAELSQLTVDEKEQREPVRKWGVETTYPTTPQKAPPSEPLGDGSPSQSWLHLYHSSDLSQSHGGIFKAASPSSPSPATPAKPRRGSGTVTPLREPDHQKGRRGNSAPQCKTRSVLISPAKSPPIDLTQSVPDHLSPRSEESPDLVKKDDEVILLLDSDEELELEQSRTKSVSNDLPEESRVLEASPKSSELFSVIDVEEDQERFQSPLKTEAKLRQEEEEGHLQNRASLGRKKISWLLCRQESSPDEDSPTDSSWLVPATPPAGRSRDGSSQTQITSLRSRTPADATAEHLPSTSEPRIVPEAPQKFSVIMPHMGPATPGTSDRGNQVFGSPARAHPRHHKLTSLALGPVRSFPRQLQKLSPAGLCQTNQAAADEVVEVGDSDDEQDAASPPGRSSPLLDSDPLVPVGDYCWPVEPLSPIPIDHLNLERTGPLHTSSPSRQAQQALDGNCCSPGLLGTTPVRGSYAAQREAREQASRASSPGSRRLSFLNPALWDDWDEEEQASPEAPQIPSTHAPKQGPETPKGANQKKNLPPKVPITPMPRYSIMETPVLKKELDRFGVRPLPKRQMVLKLKEIFQYTHQRLESDSEDELQSSHVPLEAPCTEGPAAEVYKPSRSGGHTQLEATDGPRTQKSTRPPRSRGPQRRKKQPSKSLPLPNRSPAREHPPGPDGDAQLPASQDSVTTSMDGSDSSFSSQSSSCEFGAALESDGEGEREEEEGISASQAATRAADAEEAVRRYICSKPELYRKVLMYQPLELAELQAQLKQDGVHVGTGKLLDILDAQCITFTTAATRKEKLKHKRQPRLRRRKRE